MTTAVILQPSYLPWRGYFHLIQRADVFVFYDDVQYDKHGWRNRNRIKTANGVQWLTVPVRAGGCVSNHTTIREVEIDWNRDWSVKHTATLQQAYGKRAPYYQRYAPILAAAYARKPKLLADLTIELTAVLARELGIAHTRFVRSSELEVGGERVERLLRIVQAVGADHYLSGPSAQDYIDPTVFANAGVGLEYMVYDYPPYEQLYPPFEPQVSIVDLLFMHGPEAARSIWEHRDG